MLLAWFLLIGGWSLVGCQAQVASSLARRLLSTAFFPLRHPQSGRIEWLAARQFTEKYLKALGLNVTRQEFETNVLFYRDTSQLVEGVNLISLIPGRRWDTQDEDNILLVVAHYDSDVTNLGVRPGSGMVALLEVARRLQELRLSDDVQLEHTVVLAACDLLTTAHTWGKAGDSGLEIFVQTYLNQLLSLRSSIRFRGAVILDSVFNFNSSYGTQTYPKGFAETFPGVDGDSMGDFVGVVGRECSERVLMSSLQNNWQRGPGRLVPLLLAQQPPDSQALYEVLRQGQTAFWNRVFNRVVSPLPAVMLTDTGRFRELPRRCQISNSACTPDDIITDDSIKFLNQTVDAVTNTILQLQGSSGRLLVVGWLSLTSAVLTLTILN